MILFDIYLIILNMEVSKTISEIFNTKIEDLDTHYTRIIIGISENQKEVINKSIKEKLSNYKTRNINEVILIGAVLNYTGSSSTELISYYCSYIDKRINLNQYNFIIKYLFKDNSPLSTDIIFDLSEYTYLDNKIIERKIDELSKELKPISNTQIILFLLILFFRNDLRNENYRLIYEVLTKIGGNKIKKLKNNRIIKDFLAEIKPKKLKEAKPAPKKPIQKEPKPAPEKIKKEKITIPEEEIGPIKEPNSKKVSITKKQLLILSSIVGGIIIVILLFIFLKHKKPEVHQKGTKMISQKQVPAPANTTTKEASKIQQKTANNTEKQRSENPDIETNEEAVKQYVIKKGDTLSGIAKKYYGRGYYYKHLADINKIKNPDLIYPGTKIVVPPEVNKNTSKK